MDSRRVESFSDGVFAVAITLLIFSLLPIGRGALSYGSLAHAWPQYAAYVVSFLTIGIMWMNHHVLFGHVRLVDRPLMVLNLLLLMGVVAIPFPTALVAEHLTGPNASGGRPAAVVYGLVMVVISLFYNAIWVHLIGHASALGARFTKQQLMASMPRVGVSRLRIPRWSIGLIGYLAGVVVALAGSAAGALAIYGLLAIFYMFNQLPAPLSYESQPEQASPAP
ncbi:MAG TPA: TMEM175 family protein [Streptosporangiaceae bacterium]|nr:TMEM175 family protein [Streptosporangiaceae bacterium]